MSGEIRDGSCDELALAWGVASNAQCTLHDFIATDSVSAGLII